MSGEVEKCPILHVRPKFDVFTLFVDAELHSLWMFCVRSFFWSAELCVLPSFTFI